MSALQLYRGPLLEMRFVRRLGSPFHVVFTIDRNIAAVASPGDFIALRAWLNQQLETLNAFMVEPEDPKVAENLQGNVPGEG